MSQQDKKSVKGEENEEGINFLRQQMQILISEFELVDKKLSDMARDTRVLRSEMRGLKTLRSSLPEIETVSNVYPLHSWPIRPGY